MTRKERRRYLAEAKAMDKAVRQMEVDEQRRLREEAMLSEQTGRHERRLLEKMEKEERKKAEKQRKIEMRLVRGSHLFVRPDILKNDGLRHRAQEKAEKVRHREEKALAKADHNMFRWSWRDMLDPTPPKPTWDTTWKSGCDPSWSRDPWGRQPLPSPSPPKPSRNTLFSRRQQSQFQPTPVHTHTAYTAMDLPIDPPYASKQPDTVTWLPKFDDYGVRRGPAGLAGAVPAGRVMSR
jgi:hypothetical protein